MNYPIIETILAARQDPDQLMQVAKMAESVPQLDDLRVDELLEQLAEIGGELEPSASPGAAGSRQLEQILIPIVNQLIVRESELQPTGSGWSDWRLRSVETLYQRTPSDSDLRNHLLRWLVTAHCEGAHELWTDLICDDPPEHRLGIILAFSPLMQKDFQPSPKMMGRLLQEATRHSQIAPAVFDLFNFYFRTKRVETHPATPRASQLIELLGQMAGQLGRIEDGDFPAQMEVHQLNQMVSDSVSLIVALCDTFSLLGDERAVPKLYQALALRHRRVQTEAAAALARLGDEGGKRALIELAEQPISRLRVLAYADELGFENEISLELRGEIARAESQLAIWLAEPEQMGLAPSHTRLIDNQEMFWPSYDQPVQVYLFEYSYGSEESAYRNIGICGPLTHAFAADLRHLPIPEIYAAFAGWQTVHNEIYQMAPEKARQLFPNEIRRLEGALANDSRDEVELQTAGSFFGELVLVATAKSDSQTGTLIASEREVAWYESGNPQAPIDWQLAFTIWRGQQLLNEFNAS